MWDFEIRGAYSLDAENLYINLSEVSQRTTGTASAEALRIAYGPLGDGGIIVSGWWNEPPSSERDPVGQKYGGYVHRFYKGADA